MYSGEPGRGELSADSEIWRAPSGGEPNFAGAERDPTRRARVHWASPTCDATHQEGGGLTLKFHKGRFSKGGSRRQL